MLQEVQLKYVTDAVCTAAWSPFGQRIFPSMMCAAKTGKDVCDGDDGGPLFDAKTNVLVGIISFGLCDYYPAGSLPAVFSRIANQWTWIKTTICADHSNPKPDFCPTKKPTKKPIAPPTKKPVNKPTARPTNRPINKPRARPMKAPTARPIKRPWTWTKPSRKPSLVKTKKPTKRYVTSNPAISYFSSLSLSHRLPCISFIDTL